MRHRRVTVPASALVHADARLHPRGSQLVLGERCLVAPGAIVQGSVQFGDDCSVQAYAVLVGYADELGDPGSIVIGNSVRIAPHAMLIAGNHIFDDPDRPIRSQGFARESIIVEDDVWIAGRVTITAGVTVGAGSVIAAGAVVTQDVPPGSVAAGVPARVLRARGPVTGGPGA